MSSDFSQRLSLTQTHTVLTHSNRHKMVCYYQHRHTSKAAWILYLLNIINTDILTYICCSFGYREVGAHTPGSSVVVPLTAAAVRPCGVVFTLTAQLPLVKHTAVGMQVTLAPETER